MYRILLLALFVLTACSRETSSPERKQVTAIKPPVDLPACKASDDRTKVSLWMPTYNEWKETLSSTAPEQNGKVLYIKFYADDDSRACGTSEPFRVTAARDLKLPHGGGVEIAFIGNSTLLRGTCYVEGFFMNKTSVGMWHGMTATAYEAVETKDVVLSGRYCLADTVPEPTKGQLEALGENDRLLAIESAQIVDLTGPSGHKYQEIRVRFAEAASAPKSAMCNFNVCVDLV